MLSSRTLKTLLLWFSCFFSQVLFAVSLRYYLILQITEDDSYPYVGSVTINDELQALAAQLFFPGGHAVVIEMDIQIDGHTVDLQISPGGQAFNVAPLAGQSASPIIQAIQARAGSPSDWFANPYTALHQFQLPAILPEQRIRLSRGVKNNVGDISLRFNRHKRPEIQNAGYTQGSVMLNPGAGTSSRGAGVWPQMTDAGLLQFMELLVVALASPQLVSGSRFSTVVKRDKADVTQRVGLRIDETERNTRVKQSKPSQGGVAGYLLWTLEMFGWARQFMAGPLPAGFSSAGGYGLVTTPQGQQKSCFIDPWVNSPESGVDPTVAHSLRQLGGMNIGVPPKNCRSGNQHWGGGGGGGGGGPGAGWGGGSGGYIAR